MISSFLHLLFTKFWIHRDLWQSEFGCHRVRIYGFHSHSWLLIRMLRRCIQDWVIAHLNPRFVFDWNPWHYIKWLMLFSGIMNTHQGRIKILILIIRDFARDSILWFLMIISRIFGLFIILLDGLLLIKSANSTSTNWHFVIVNAGQFDLWF